MVNQYIHLFLIKQESLTICLSESSM